MRIESAPSDRINLPSLFAGNANSAANSAPTASRAAGRSNADQVQLSDGARLASQAEQAGAVSEQVLGDLTRQALSSLGILSKAEALGAKIEFDSFSYKASSTTSIVASRSVLQYDNGRFGAARPGNARPEGGSGSLSASSLQFRSEQQTEITGRGRITTADGRQFEFDAALLLENRQEFQQTQIQSEQAESGINTAQNVASLRGAVFAENSPLFKALEDILQQLSGERLPPAGIAVGEPNPQTPAKTEQEAAGESLLNLNQVQQGAARLAKQLEEFTDLNKLRQPALALA